MLYCTHVVGDIETLDVNWSSTLEHPFSIKSISRGLWIEQMLKSERNAEFHIRPITCRVAYFSDLSNAKGVRLWDCSLYNRDEFKAFCCITFRLQCEPPDNPSHYNQNSIFPMSLAVAPSKGPRGPSWVHENPYLTIGWEETSESGAPSLKHSAMRQTLSDQSILTPELFANVPWTIAKYLWDCLGKR